MSESATNRWIFDLNRLQNSPSKRDGIGHHQQLNLRQKGTNLIKEMSQQLKLRPICMNTAIVYFHRFFALRSFKWFDVNRIAVCSLYLSSKFEEQPIFKEHIIKLWFHCRRKPLNDQVLYEKECCRLIENENEMLLTFGFDLSVTHMQTVICTASNPTVINPIIQRNAYIIARDLLRLTTICLEYSPQFSACVCIYLSSTFLDIPIKDKTWCELIDKQIKLSDVQREAPKFKCFIDKNRLSIDDKTRKQSFDSSASPESAYSSGSPDFDYQSSSEKESNKTNNNISDRLLIQTNQRTQIDRKLINTSANSVVRLKPIGSDIKSNLLANNKPTAKREAPSNGVHSNSYLSKYKYRKIVKTNGQTARVAVNPPKDTTKQPTVTSAPKVSDSSNNSSTKQKSISSGTSLLKNRDIKKLNLKITFSTNSGNKTESNKRIVESIKSTQQTVKIES